MEELALLETIKSLIVGLYDNQKTIDDKINALVQASINNLQKDHRQDLININNKLDKILSKTSDIETRLQALDDINNKDPEIEEIKIQLNEVKDQINQLTIYRDLY